MAKKSREDLKGYFRRNMIPTEGHFEHLIDSALNLHDDGLEKTSNGPLKLSAGDNATDEAEILKLFAGRGDNQSSVCVLKLNPRADAKNPASAKVGLAFQGADRKTRLFLDLSSGNVGIGVVEPSAARLQFANELGNKIVVWDGGDADRYGLGLNRGNLNLFIPDKTHFKFSIRHNNYDGKEIFSVSRNGSISCTGSLQAASGQLGSLQIGSDQLKFDNDHGDKILFYSNEHNGELHRYGFGLQHSAIVAFLPPYAKFSIRQHGQKNSDATLGAEVLSISGDGTLVSSGSITCGGSLSIAEHEAWKQPEKLGGPWEHDQSVWSGLSYFKDPLNIVHLRGRAKCKGIEKVNPIFQMPVGYRPEQEELHSVCSKFPGQDFSVYGSVQIRTNGEISLLEGGHDNVCFDGITYRAR